MNNFIHEKIINNGFTIIKNKNIKKEIKNFADYIFENFENIINNSNTENIFKDNNLIKQIQNLHNNKYFLDFSTNIFKELEIANYNILNIQIFIKHPNYKITCPHQDGAYFNDSNKQIYTIWIPLQDVNKDNSCLYYLPKSHLNGLLKHDKSGNTIRTRTGVTGYSLENYDYELQEYQEVKLNLGDFVVHDQFTLHYSSMNITNKVRYALSIIFSL